MRKRDGVIIWPAYLDSTLTRNQGRRIPKNLGAPELSFDILVEAADAISMEYTAETGKLYPRLGREPKGSGYLVIANPQGHKKKRLLLMLAKSVRRVVAQRESKKQAAAKKSKGKKRKKDRKRES